MQFEIQWQTVEGQIAPWARMQEVTTALKDYEKNSRVKVPRIFTEVKVTVRVQTCILNLDAVSRALGRPLIYIMKYFSYKLGTMIYKKKGRVIIHGLHGKKKLYQLLKDFSQKFVLCPICKKMTALSANEVVDTLQKRCRECDYKGHLDSTDKLSRFIWRHKTMESMSEQLRTTLPESKETNCADKLRYKKNATKLKKNRLPVVLGIPDIPRHDMDTHIQDDDFIVFEEREALPIVENKIIIKNEENNIKNEEENKIIIKSKKVKTTACGKRKLFPKILITRIPKNVKEGDIIENLKDKNPWLRYLIKNEDDFKLVATLKADTYGRPQYAIKCSPQIRRNIAACGDELNILGTFCKVYDKYHVLRCIKCQKFGHKHDLCRGELVCPKCGGEHWLRECISEVSTCLHCQGPHITGDRVCQKYKEEEASVKDRTDHGEHLEVFKPDLQSERAERENIAKQQKIIKQEAQRKKKKAKSNITVVLGDQVIITNLCKTRKYKKDMCRYFNLIDTLQLTE